MRHRHRSSWRGPRRAENGTRREEIDAYHNVHVIHLSSICAHVDQRLAVGIKPRQVCHGGADDLRRADSSAFRSAAKKLRKLAESAGENGWPAPEEFGYSCAVGS